MGDSFSKNPFFFPLSGLASPKPNGLAAALLGIPTQSTKRRVFFSFHYDDIMRVNNVRNVWKIDHPDSALIRSFYDSSLWESKKAEGDEAVKTLIREGVQNTSAVCVLVGTETWSRRWVKYEIARSVVDERGLLAVHLNNLNHHRELKAHPLGFNPLHLLGVFRAPEGNFYLYEKRHVLKNYLTGEMAWEWWPYGDYQLPVTLPKYLSAPDVGYVRPLSTGASEYDFVLQIGNKNLGAWIDLAAQRVGR